MVKGDKDSLDGAIVEKAHLIGAFGMLWDRDAVNWRPGVTPTKWQLLGYRGRHNPKLRACDFRTARGFYVLFDDFRAVYAGLARGTGGIGARLRTHHVTRSDWTRFCWFSFDDVADCDWSCTWAEVKPRVGVRDMSAEIVVREAEALLISVLGLTDQHSMRFQTARRWRQLTDAEFVPGAMGQRLDATGFTDPHFRALLT